MDQNYLINSKH